MALCLPAIIGCLLHFAGCSHAVDADGTNKTESASEQTHKVTFTDDLGREITVENPKRVAALLGSFVDIWYLAGGSVVACAEDAWDDFNLPLGEETINLGMTKELSLEKLFEANPDFVIASSNTRQNMEWKETLETAGINVAYFHVNNFDDYLRVLKIFTDITGRNDLYEENGISIQKQMEEIVANCHEQIKEDGKAPKILILRASATLIKAKGSRDNVLGELLKGLGCENIADSDRTLLENLNVEHIMLEEPDYIFIAQHGDNPEAIQMNINKFMSENPAWNNLEAVKEQRVYYMEKELFTLKPNDRWAEAYEKAAAILSEGKSCLKE
uniref:ABC transporter substrate-binding protein n=1 Tax=Agathobacter sp. TaxID=2021311 RepID=UPI00405724C5